MSNNKFEQLLASKAAEAGAVGEPMTTAAVAPDVEATKSLILTGMAAVGALSPRRAVTAEARPDGYYSASVTRVEGSTGMIAGKVIGGRTYWPLEGLDEVAEANLKLLVERKLATLRVQGKATTKED